MFDQYIKKRDRLEVIQILSDDQPLTNKKPPPIFPLLPCKQEEVSSIVKQMQKKVKPQTNDDKVPQPAVVPAKEVKPVLQAQEHITDKGEPQVNEVQCSQSSNEYDYQHVINCFQEQAKGRVQKLNQMPPSNTINQTEKTAQIAKETTNARMQQQAPIYNLRQTILKNWMTNLIAKKRES